MSFIQGSYKAYGKIDTVLDLRHDDTLMLDNPNKKSILISLHDIFDILIVEKKKIDISIQGKYAKGVCNNAENIVHKAIKAFFKKRPMSFGVDCCITKNIPLGTGLSEDKSAAARALCFLHEYCNIPINIDEYLPLGKDICFFLEHYTSSNHLSVQKLFGLIFFFSHISFSKEWLYMQYAQDTQNENIAAIKNSRISVHNYNDFSRILLPRFFDIKLFCDSLHEYTPDFYGIAGEGSAVYALFLDPNIQEKVFLEKGGEKIETICAA